MRCMFWKFIDNADICHFIQVNKWPRRALTACLWWQFKPNFNWRYNFFSMWQLIFTNLRLYGGLVDCIVCQTRASLFACFQVHTNMHLVILRYFKFTNTAEPKFSVSRPTPKQSLTVTPCCVILASDMKFLQSVVLGRIVPCDPLHCVE
jgi:hypothetical protein